MISRTVTTVLLACALLMGAAAPAAAQDSGEENTKRAQTGMKFLSASLSPRVAGMGGTGTTLQLQSTALFYNPAGMAQMENFGHASVGTMQWIADINYNNASVSIRPSGGTYGVIGFTFMQVDYGELERTVRDNTRDQGYQSMGTFSPGSWAVGLGYAYPVTDRISVGAKVKYAKQDLGESIMSADGTTKSNDLGTGAYDFGIQYDTNYRGIQVAMSVRNFSPEVQYEQQSFELPMELSVGVSADVLEAAQVGAPNDQHSLNVMVKGVTPRDFSERMHFGGEYTFMDTFSLRTGYSIPGTDTEEGVNFGAGLQTGISGFELGADYSYTTYDVFDGVNRIAVNIGF